MQIGFGTYFELQSHNKGVVQFVFGYYVTPMTIGIFMLVEILCGDGIRQCQG
jgi:hypothetical protein